MVAIDISYAQTTNMDFVAMRSAVNTVIMKAGGSNSGRYVDSKYRWFEPRARSAGMRIGHYWFNGTGDPTTDADFFVNNLSGYTPNDLLALDIESEGSMSYASPAWALTFVNRVKQRTGRNCDVYMSSSVTRAQNWQPLVNAGSKLWVAQYGTNSGSPQGSPNIGYWPTWKLWQYSSNGSVPGYAARVDINQINEAQWAGGGSTPIEEEDMIYPWVFVVLDGNVGRQWYAWNGAYKIPADQNLVNNLVGCGLAAPVASVPVKLLGPYLNFIPDAPVSAALGQAQIDSLSQQIATEVISGLPNSGDVTVEQIKSAVTSAVTPIVNGAVTNLAQDNLNQTNAIKGFTYKAV